MNVAFLQELFSDILRRERELVSAEPRRRTIEEIAGLCHALLSGRGEASGIALASEIAAGYGAFTPAERLQFFKLLKDEFGPDRTQLKQAAASYLSNGTVRAERVLLAAAEPQRQELLRRINLAPGNTGRLVAMREDLLGFLKEHKDLEEVDADFAHLFGSWFNRGFLVMQHIDWSTPAIVLERIIRYERVHVIKGWDDLHRRIDPIDRRCYAFFHPALADVPLIFVQVALTPEIPAAVAPLLAEKREVVRPVEQATAVFYSISNTQEGLKGVTFGNFLIKQVAGDLKREIPWLKTFVTLSPVPGFAAWLASERAKDSAEAPAGDAKDRLALLDEPGWAADPAKAESLKEAVLPVAAYYFLKAKNKRGRPVDPVARFHLGNGARLERLNWLGDTSPNGLRQSHGLMVNYLYALDEIERNHEDYSNEGHIAASPAVRALLKG